MTLEDRRVELVDEILRLKQQRGATVLAQQLSAKRITGEIRDEGEGR